MPASLVRRRDLILREILEIRRELKRMRILTQIVLTLYLLEDKQAVDLPLKKALKTKEMKVMTPRMISEDTNVTNSLSKSLRTKTKGNTQVINSSNKGTDKDN